MFQEELILCSFVKGGVRAGGGKGGGGLPQIFEPPIFGGVQEKIWAKPVFENVFIFYYYSFFYVWCIFYFYYYFIIFHVFEILSWSRRNIPVTFTQGSGCLARGVFLVIREGYHMLIYIFVFFLILFGTALAGMGSFRSWID